MKPLAPVISIFFFAYMSYFLWGFKHNRQKEHSMNENDLYIKLYSRYI